MEEMGG